MTYEMLKFGVVGDSVVDVEILGTLEADDAASAISMVFDDAGAAKVAEAKNGVYACLEHDAGCHVEKTILIAKAKA